MSLQTWGDYARTVPVLENRQQSLAFLYGIGLKPQPLKFPSKHVYKGPWNLDDWRHIDTQQNYGAPLVGDLVDLDVDVRPLGLDKSENYTPAFYAAALPILHAVHAALDHAGLRFRAFGRTSLGRTGHFIIELPVGKGEEDLLRRLQMAKPVECEGIRVRIECRRRALKQETQKNFTLPGSVYVRQDGAGLDLIQWSVLSTFGESEVMPKLDPQPYDKARLGIYMALMGLALLPHWEAGTRHECAFEMAGCLAHEWRQGTFSEDECKAIMQYMIDQTGDTEVKSRMKDLDNSLAGIQAHKHITGYKTLAERVGDEWKNALLRLRGGGDPDALGALFEAVGRVLYGVAKSNTYVDLSAGPERYVEMDAAGLAMRFSNRSEYPDIYDAKGKRIPAIRIVMNSPHILTFDQAVSFPGIPFGVQYTKDAGGTYQEIDHENPPSLGVPRYLNVAAGFATEPYRDGEAPDKAIFEEARNLYIRLREHLVADEVEAKMLNQIIAHKLQRPREKHATGLAMVGGQHIGKSFLFDIVLKKLIGDQLVKKSSGTDLKSEKRFNGIDRCLFYVVEECKLGELPRETLQLVKDVMRNPTVFVDVKYGRIGEVQNRAVPIFLSNEYNPQLIFDGVPDRALCIVHGERPEDLGMTKDEWKSHQATIHEECIEFAKALERVEIRRALLHYFLDTVPWNVALITMNNESRTGALDVEHGMRPALQALVAMLREGYFMPLQQGDRGPMIDGPVMLETIGAGMRARLKDQRIGYDQRETNNQGVGRAFAELFMEPDGRRDGKRRSEGVDRAKREKVLKMVRHFTNRQAIPIYYFAFRRGELLAMLEERRGIKIEPDYELDPDGERGPAPEPSREDMARAYNFATTHASQSSLSILMGGLT